MQKRFMLQSVLGCVFFFNALYPALKHASLADCIKQARISRGQHRSVANLAIAKTDDAIGIKNVGDSVSYTIEVTNNDSGTVDDITVTDILPIEVLLTSATPSQGTYDAGTGVWSIGSLDASTSATLVLATTVTASEASSRIVTNTSTITNPALADPYSVGASAFFGLQRFCPTTNYGLIQASAVSTDGIASVSNLSWHAINDNIYALATLSLDPFTSFPVLLQFALDPAPDLLFLCILPSSSNSTAFDWLDIGGANYIAVGSSVSGSQMQLYQFDSLQPACDGLNVLQSIDTSQTITTLKWVTVNGIAYLAVGLASNELQLYSFDGVSTLTLIQTLTLENNYAGSQVVQVNTVSWQSVEGTHYLAVGLQSGSVSDDNPLLQLYVLSDDAVPQLNLVDEVRSTIASESLTSLDWNVVNDTVFLATGEQQPVASATKPEVVRLYRLDANYLDGSLVEEYRVPTANIDGFVYSVAWKGVFLSVGGLLGNRLGDSSFSDGSKLFLCQLSTAYGPELAVIDDVSTIVLDGAILATGWQPGLNNDVLMVAGAMVDNGTSGASHLRLYTLCYNADISVMKTVNNTTPLAGEEVTYTITAMNGSGNRIFNAQIVEQLGEGMDFVSATVSKGAFNSESGVWTIGDLEVGEIETLTIVGRVALTSGGWAITNTATISAPNVVITDLDGSASITVNVQVPLVIRKTVDRVLASAGDMVNFTLIAQNNSLGMAGSVTVYELLPSELIFILSSPSKGEYDSVAGLWTIGALAPGEVETLTITAQVAPGQSVTQLAINTATIFDAYGVFDPYGNSGQVALGVQRSCSAGEDQLIERTRIETDAISAVTHVVWPASQGSALAAALVEQVYSNVTQLMVLRYDGAQPTVTELCSVDLPGIPTALEWLDIGDSSFVVVGNSQADSGMQLYRVVSTYSNCLELLQTIDTGVGVSSIAATFIEGNPYLAVGLLSNEIQLYGLDMMLSTPSFTLLQTIMLDDVYDSTVVAVPAVKWQTVGSDIFLAAGLAGGSTSDNNPLVQLYRVTFGDTPLLEFISQVTSTVAQEQVSTLDWNTINGTTYLAIGEQQVIASLTKPEPVRLYRLDGSSLDAFLTEVYRVPTSDIDGFIKSVQWNGLFLAVGGQLGTREGSGFTQGDPLRLCKFNTIEGPQIPRVDSVSTVVVNGTVSTVAWMPVSISETLVVGGAPFVDNGTSGSSQARIYTLCAAACDLAIVQSVNKVTPQVGEVVTYTITLSNGGPNRVDGILISDVLSDEFVYVTSSANQGTYNNISGLWTVGSIESGAAAQLNIIVVMGCSSFGRSIDNTATIVDGCANNPYANTTQTTITVQPCMSISSQGPVTVRICSE